MAIPMPDLRSRWRCRQCGNLTRFDVQRATRAREYWHVDLAGVPVVEERAVLADAAEHVTCRWCAGQDTVELEPRPDGTAKEQPAGPAS